jgi:hypothetical protein
MKLTLLTVLACSLFPTQALDQKWNDRDAMGLRGPVRKVRIEKARITRQDGKSVEGPRRIESETTFDESGSKIEECRYQDDGSLRDRLVVVSRDARGRKLEQVRYKPDGSVLYRMRHEYEYDEAGRVVSETVKSAELKLWSRLVTIRDPRGRETERLQYDESGKLISKSVWVYGGDGEMIEFLSYDGAGALVQRNKPPGKGDEIINYNPDGSIRSKTSFTHPTRESPDTHGNWTRSVWTMRTSQSGKDEEVTEVTYRTITYY